MSLFGGGGGGAESFIGEGLMSTPITFANGGRIPYRMANGGRSAATANRDGVPVSAMPGEYMLRKSAAEAIGYDTLDQVNALGGQMVDRAPKIEPSQKFGGANASANVYVVDRDQVPPPSKNDIIHMIGEDIQRGGATKQLIKQVAAGG
jgi:hypothetical protein